MALPMSPQSAPTTSPPPTTTSLVTSSGASDDGAFDIKRWLRVGRDEPQTVAYLDSLYARAKSQRWRFDRQWYVNLSFYFGRQWVNWLNGSSPELSRLHEPQAPPWRVRLVVNRVRPTIRREMAKVMKEKPTAFVIPSSTEDNDVAAAKAGEAIFEHLWRTMDMPTELWMAQFWRCVLGTGFIKDWWTPESDSENPNGKVQTEVVTPFHLYFANLDQYRIDKQDYIIHVSMKSPEAVKAMYGVSLKADTDEIGGGVIEAQYLQALNLEPSQKMSQVTVKEAWIRPCPRYPKGVMIVWAGGKILYKSTDETGEAVWPLPSPEYPFTKFDGVPTGRFYGDSSIIDLLPLQKEYNRTRSQIIEAKNQMAKPQLMAPRGSIDASKITSEPGLVIFYTPGFNPPNPIPLSPLPSYVMQELDRTLADMSDISGQHEIANGTTPAGVTAASALSYLQEQDDTMLAPIIHSMEAGIERLGRHFLVHVQKYWDATQAVKVLGPDNTWEMHQFTKASLAGNTDLNIQAGSAMPRSLAAKQAFIMELAKMQLITPEQTLRYLELAETGQMYEETQVDQRQAGRENMRMSEGQRCPVNSWDNHEAHLQSLNTYRKRQEFENLDEQTQALFEEHANLHRAALGLPPSVNPEQMAAVQQNAQLQQSMVGDPNAAPADPNAALDPTQGMGANPAGDPAAAGAQVPPLGGAMPQQQPGLPQQ